MILHRIVVKADYPEPIKFWMTGDQVKYFSDMLIPSENCYIISITDYRKLTGVKSWKN